MREFAKVAPQFWMGQTGKEIRAAGLEAQLLALYLITCPHASMIGLYYLPLPYIVHDTGLSPEGALKGLRSLSEAHFCRYDALSEWVWVIEMATYQIGPTLDPRDKRIIGLNRELRSLGNCPFLQDFYQRYGAVFHLENPCKKASPFGAPSEPLPSTETETEIEIEIERKSKEENTCRPVGKKVARKIRHPAPAYTPGFLAWWEAYPSDRRFDKAQCFAAWTHLALESRTAELVEKLERLKVTTWNTPERRYVKTALPYLNSKRYEEEPPPARPALLNNPTLAKQIESAQRWVARRVSPSPGDQNTYEPDRLSSLRAIDDPARRLLSREQA